MRILLMFFVIIGLTSCFERQVRDLKSPCAANEFSSDNAINPCVKRPVNTWLIS